MEIHRGFLEKAWCDGIISSYLSNFEYSPRGKWNAYTLSKENPLYGEIFRKFSPLVPYDFNVNWINITVYEKGRGLGHHKDEASSLTIVSNLNEDYQGGAFILNKREKYELKVGDVLLFNGSTTYHGVEPIESGIRYSLNLWTTPANTSII